MTNKIKIILLLIVSSFQVNAQETGFSNIYPKFKSITYDNLKNYIVFQGVVETNAEFTRHLLIVNKNADNYSGGKVELVAYTQDFVKDGSVRGFYRKIEMVPKKKSKPKALYKSVYKVFFPSTLNKITIPLFATSDVRDLTQLLDGALSIGFTTRDLEYLYLKNAIGPFKRAQFKFKKESVETDAILFPNATEPLYGTRTTDDFVYEGTLNGTQANYGRKTYANGDIEEGVFRKDSLIYAMKFDEPSFKTFSFNSEEKITKIINQDTISGYDFNPDPNRELLISENGALYIGDKNNKDIQLFLPKKIKKERIIEYGNRPHTYLNLVGQLNIGQFDNGILIKGVKSKIKYRMEDYKGRLNYNEAVSKMRTPKPFMYYLQRHWFSYGPIVGTFKNDLFNGCVKIYGSSLDFPDYFGNFIDNKPVGVYYQYESIRFNKTKNNVPFDYSIESNWDKFLAYYRAGNMPCFAENEIELEFYFARNAKWNEIRKKNMAHHSAKKQYEARKKKDKLYREQASYFAKCHTCDGSGLWEWKYENETTQYIYKSSALIKCGKCHGTGKIKKLDFKKYQQLKSN